jgi:hypothetical protein
LQHEKFYFISTRVYFKPKRSLFTNSPEAMTQIPVLLFVYARPDHMRRTLESLRDNQVPLIYAYSDGPRTPDKAQAVGEVREMLRAVDWCEIVLSEREENLGLGRSILAGVKEALEKHEAVIVFEDDLVCVPGTYAYLCAALEHYKNEPSVMSVTGWTHPLVTPKDIDVLPYFDGRAECWVWGTWARAWRGMDQDAETMMRQCEANGIDVYRYGADLPVMAEMEQRKNIWAVRFLYWHILNRGLCLRPPWSLVEHIGWDALATNMASSGQWASEPLKACPPIPEEWPRPVENPECARLWRKSVGRRPTWIGNVYKFIRQVASKIVRRLSVS